MQAVNGREIYTQVSMGNMWGVIVCLHACVTEVYILYLCKSETIIRNQLLAGLNLVKVQNTSRGDHEANVPALF